MLRPTPPPVFLLGMMGSGKSTVGRLLAGRWRATFVDLDARIERLFGASVSALFERGEAGFRGLERAALVSLLREPGFAGAAAVVATGGGIVCDPRNLDDIAAIGPTVYLELAPAALAARLSTPDELRARPLLDRDPAALDRRVAALLEVRAPAYRRASVTVDGDASPDLVATRVERALARG